MLSDEDPVIKPTDNDVVNAAPPVHPGAPDGSNNDEGFQDQVGTQTETSPDEQNQVAPDGDAKKPKWVCMPDPN